MSDDSIIFTKEFWKATVTRAVRTFAQGMLGAIGTGVVGIIDVNWLQAASLGAGSAVVSVIMSVAWPDGVPEAKK